MGTVATLSVRVTAQTTEFEKNISALEKNWQRVGSKFENAGASLTKGLTLPILALGGSAAKAALSFESSFTGIRKTVQGTEQQFAALAQGMRDMAKVKPVDVNELNKIGEIGGQLGIATDGILTFTDVVSDMQIATGLSTEQISRGLGNIAKLTGTPAEGFRALGDTIAALGDAGSATEGQVIDFGERIGAAGALAGMSANEILAIGGAMANIGVEAEAGGTAVQKVIFEMVSAVQLGGSELNQFASVAGMSGDAFKQAFSADPGGAFLAFVEGLEKQGKGAIQTLNELGLSDTRLQRAFLGLASAGGTLRSSFDVAANSTGRLKTEVDKFTATGASQLKLLYNAANDVAITFGQVLVPQLLRLKPAIEDAIRLVADGVQWFSQLPEPVQSTAIAMTGLATVLGPVAYGIGQIAKAGSALFGLTKLTGVAGILGGIGVAMKEVITFTAAFGWEGFAVGLSGVGKAVVALAAANPVTFFVGLGAAVISLAETWTEAIAVIAAAPIGGIISSWRQLREGWDTAFGDIQMPNLPKSPGMAINKPFAPGMGGDQALALLENQLKGGRGGGGGGGGGGKPPEKSPLEKAIEGIQERMKSAVVDAKAWAAEVERQGGVTNATAYAKGELADALETVVKQYGSLEKAGLGAMEPLLSATKEVLESTRAVSKEVAIYTGVSMGAGGNLGGMLSQLQMLASSQETVGSGRLKGSLGKYTSLQDLANQAGMGAMPDVQSLNVAEQVAEYTSEQLAKTADETVDGIRSAFQYFTGSLSDGMAAMLGGVMNMLEKGIANSPTMQKLLGKFGKHIGTGLDSLMAGFGFGEALGKGKGAAAGAGSGALTGLMAGGPVGALVGGIAGLFGGLFGGGKKKREEQAKMNEARGQLVDEFGGMAELEAAAARAGVSVATLFATDDAKLFQSELEKVTGAIEEMQKRVASTVGAIDDVMSKGGLIGRELWQSILQDQDAEEIKAKLQEVFDASVQRSAEGFTKIATNFELLKRPLNEIGPLADAAFAGLIAGGASIPEALSQMGEGLSHIQELMAKSGETATGPLAMLLDYQAIAEAHAGIFELVSGVDDMIVGLGNSGLLTQERFMALGSTITSAFAQLTAQGVAGSTALEMMQPQLQRLWEAQQTFGLETDAATQALLDQAETQGIVGEAMKDVNSQILDVLKAIAVALGAEIPGALAGLPGAAKNAANGFRNAFEGMPDIKVGFKADWDFGGMPQPSGPTGGTGSRTGGAPTPVASPVLPPPSTFSPPSGDSLMSSDDWREPANLNVTVNGTADREFAKILAKQVSLGGSTLTAWQGAVR
jgi:TP901 family phage tail tape measure protein